MHTDPLLFPYTGDDHLRRSRVTLRDDTRNKKKKILLVSVNPHNLIFQDTYLANGVFSRYGQHQAYLFFSPLKFLVRHINRISLDSSSRYIHEEKLYSARQFVCLIVGTRKRLVRSQSCWAPSVNLVRSRRTACAAVYV